MLPLTTFYRSGAHRSDVYKWDAFVTSWRFYNRAWQPQRHDRQPETSGTLWIHRGALTNQRSSLATGCGITRLNVLLRTAVVQVHIIHVHGIVQLSAVQLSVVQLSVLQLPYDHQNIQDARTYHTGCMNIVIHVPPYVYCLLGSFYWQWSTINPEWISN